MLEAVAAQLHQTLIIDMAAKALVDNCASLMCAAAAEHADLPRRSRKCNRSDVANLMQRVLPRLVGFIGDVCAPTADSIAVSAATSQRFVPNRSGRRPSHYIQLRPSRAYKR